MTMTQLRERASEAISRVQYSGERIPIERHGKDVAVLISVEDAELLEALEDRADLAAIRAALKNPGTPVPWDQVKADLGL
jgi:prevent-host-death family protein